MPKFKQGDSAVVADKNSWYKGRICTIDSSTVYDDLIIYTVAVGNVTFAVRESELASL